MGLSLASKNGITGPCYINKTQHTSCWPSIPHNPTELDERKKHGRREPLLFRHMPVISSDISLQHWLIHGTVIAKALNCWVQELRLWNPTSRQKKSHKIQVALDQTPRFLWTKSKAYMISKVASELILAVKLSKFAEGNRNLEPLNRDFPWFSTHFFGGDVDFQAMHPLTASRWDVGARSVEDLARRHGAGAYWESCWILMGFNGT